MAVHQRRRQGALGSDEVLRVRLRLARLLSALLYRPTVLLPTTGGSARPRTGRCSKASDCVVVAAQLYRIDRIGIVNPRAGVLVVHDLELLCVQTSGRPAAELFDDLIATFQELATST
jgi:hypothetical protein